MLFLYVTSTFFPRATFSETRFAAKSSLAEPGGVSMTSILFLEESASTRIVFASESMGRTKKCSAGLKISSGFLSSMSESTTWNPLGERRSLAEKFSEEDLSFHLSDSQSWCAKRLAASKNPRNMPREVLFHPATASTARSTARKYFRAWKVEPSQKIFAGGSSMISLLFIRRGTFSTGATLFGETVRFSASSVTGTNSKGAVFWARRNPMERKRFCDPVSSSRVRSALRKASNVFFCSSSVKVALVGAKSASGRAMGFRYHFSKKGMPSSAMSGVWNLSFERMFKNLLFEPKSNEAMRKS